MSVLENKIISIIIMIILIVSGFLLGGYKSLKGLYNDAYAVFFVGEDKDGICIANDLSERAACAANMVTVASKYSYFSQGAAADSLIKLTKAGAALNTQVSENKHGDISKALIANQELDTAMSSVYRELENVELSRSDEKFRQKIYADFNSRNDMISHDPFNSYAEEYNEVLKGFPANIISAVMLVKDLSVAY